MFVRDLEIEKIPCQEEKVEESFLNLIKDAKRRRKRIITVSKYKHGEHKGIFLLEVFSKYKKKNSICIRSFLIYKDYSKLVFFNETFATEYYLFNYVVNKSKEFVSCFFIDFEVSSSQSLNSLLFNKKNRLENIIKVFM